MGVATIDAAANGELATQHPGPRPTAGQRRARAPMARGVVAVRWRVGEWERKRSACKTRPGRSGRRGGRTCVDVRRGGRRGRPGGFGDGRRRGRAEGGQGFPGAPLDGAWLVIEIWNLRPLPRVSGT